MSYLDDNKTFKVWSWRCYVITLLACGIIASICYNNNSIWNKEVMTKLGIVIFVYMITIIMIGMDKSFGSKNIKSMYGIEEEILATKASNKARWYILFGLIAFMVILTPIDFYVHYLEEYESIETQKAVAALALKDGDGICNMVAITLTAIQNDKRAIGSLADSTISMKNLLRECEEYRVILGKDAQYYSIMKATDKVLSHATLCGPLCNAFVTNLVDPSAGPGAFKSLILMLCIVGIIISVSVVITFMLYRQKLIYSSSATQIRRQLNRSRSHEMDYAKSLSSPFDYTSPPSYPPIIPSHHNTNIISSKEF